MEANSDIVSSDSTITGAVVYTSAPVTSGSEANESDQNLVSCIDTDKDRRIFEKLIKRISKNDEVLKEYFNNIYIHDWNISNIDANNNMGISHDDSIVDMFFPLIFMNQSLDFVINEFARIVYTKNTKSNIALNSVNNKIFRNKYLARSQRNSSSP